MAKFNYKAKEQSGRSINGVVEASTIEAAQKLLKEKDLIILSVKEKKELAFMDKITESFAHVSNRDIVFFSRELSVLVASTVPLVRALRIIVKQTSHKNFKKIISEIATDIEGGMKFSEALAHYPKVFDDFFVFMIKAGETTGRLDEVLNYLADQKEKDYILLSNVRNAMIYPAFIIFALIAVGIGALIFVVPQLTAILIEGGVELPLSTRILIGISNVAKNYWWMILIALVTFGVVFYFLRNLEGFRYQLDFLKLKIPIAGKIFQKIYLTRFARSFANLLTSGVPITKALQITSDIVNNKVYKKIIDETAREVETGNPIQKTLMKSKFIPPMLSHMIGIGEETGRLDQILQKIADFFGTEVESGVKTLVNLIEPIVIMLLGVAAAFLVMSILLPMYDLSSAIG